MPRPRKTTPQPGASKRDAILNAMLDVVTEHGFHDAPMSLVAKRAGASPGVIYHHFASKDAIIHALYQRVSEIKHRAILEGYSPQMPPREAFIRLWTNTYHFYRRHQREMRFLEQYEIAGFSCIPRNHISDLNDEIERRFRPRSKGGVLVDWPADVTYEIILGPISRLARLPRRLPATTLAEIAERLWEAVRAPDA